MSTQNKQINEDEDNPWGPSGWNEPPDPKKYFSITYNPTYNTDKPFNLMSVDFSITDYAFDPPAEPTTFTLTLLPVPSLKYEVKKGDPTEPGGDPHFTVNGEVELKPLSEPLEFMYLYVDLYYGPNVTQRHVNGSTVKINLFSTESATAAKAIPNQQNQQSQQGDEQSDKGQAKKKKAKGK